MLITRKSYIVFVLETLKYDTLFRLSRPPMADWYVMIANYLVGVVLKPILMLCMKKTTTNVHNGLVDLLTVWDIFVKLRSLDKNNRGTLYITFLQYL